MAEEARRADPAVAGGSSDSPREAGLVSTVWHPPAETWHGYDDDAGGDWVMPPDRSLRTRVGKRAATGESSPVLPASEGQLATGRQEGRSRGACVRCSCLTTGPATGFQPIV